MNSIEILDAVHVYRGMYLSFILLLHHDTHLAELINTFCHHFIRILSY